MKKIVLLLMTLLASLSAWAIEQDGNGYYLIGSAADWDAFAGIVTENPTANAKMIADVNLGTDQTMIAGGEYFFSGIFDGQGHTLTVSYDSSQTIAPFGSIKNSTIKNLHVDGSIHSSVGPLSCVAIMARGIENISNVWVSANVTSSCKANDLSCFGVMVGRSASGNTYVYITDCLFSGTIATYGKQNGFFMGHDGYLNRATTTNCLSIGTFDYYSASSAYFPGTYENTYARQFKIGFNTDAVPEAMQCTDEQLGDGTIATALQAGRDEVVWVQDELNGNPMLAVFMTPKPGDVNSDWFVDINDVTQLIDVVLGKNVEYNAAAADCNIDGGDGLVDINDVTALISRVLTGHW